MASLDFGLKNIDERRKYISEEIKDTELMSKKHKKECKALNFFEHFLFYISAVNGCVIISAFASLIGVPVGIAGSAVGIRISAITAGIKKYKSVIKKKNKKARSYSVISKN